MTESSLPAHISRIKLIADASYSSAFMLILFLPVPFFFPALQFFFSFKALLLCHTPSCYVGSAHTKSFLRGKVREYHHIQK